MIHETDHADRSPRGPMLVGPDRPDLRDDKFERLPIADERNWLSGVHGGSRLFARGRMSDLPGPAREERPS